MRMKKPPHPGRIVRQECIDPLGLTVTETAKRLGVTRQALEQSSKRQRAASRPRWRCGFQSVRIKPGSVARHADGIRSSRELRKKRTTSRSNGSRERECSFAHESSAPIGSSIRADCLEAAWAHPVTAAAKALGSFASGSEQSHSWPQARISPEAAIRLDKAFGGGAQRRWNFGCK